MSLFRRHLFFCALFMAAPVWSVRVVSLLPSHSEVLEAMGAGDLIVGVTVFDDLAKKGRTSVGDFVTPSLETIVSLKPDLILAGPWKGSRAITQLREMGYRVEEVPYPRSFNDMLATFQILGDWVGKGADAQALVERTSKELKLLCRKPPYRWHAYLEIDTPQWTIGGRDVISDALRCAGAENIFKDMTTLAGQVSHESLIARQPDVIISLKEKASRMKRRPGWTSLQAVQKNHLVDDILVDDFTRPSPRLLRGIRHLQERLDAWEKNTSH